MTTAKLVSVALRQAAKKISMTPPEDCFSCNAAFQAGGRWALYFYQELLTPCMVGYPHLLVSNFGRDAAAREHRVMALLMAAEVAESEGL